MTENKKPARTPVVDEVETFMQKGLDAQTTVDAVADGTVLRSIADAVDLDAPPIVIDKARENGQTHVTITDVLGHVHFEATHGVEGLTKAQRIAYRDALSAAAAVNATEKAKAGVEVATSTPAPTTTTAAATKRATTPTAPRERVSSGDADADAKYGPMRAVKRVIRTVGARDEVELTCGHTRTMKTGGGKRARCRDCRSASLDATQSKKPPRTPVTETPPAVTGAPKTHVEPSGKVKSRPRAPKRPKETPKPAQRVSRGHKKPSKKTVSKKGKKR